MVFLAKSRRPETAPKQISNPVLFRGYVSYKCVLNVRIYDLFAYIVYFAPHENRMYC